MRRYQSTPFGSHPRRRRLSWKVSLASVLIPLLGVVGTVGYVHFVREDRLLVTVVDAYSGRPVVGAQVRAGEVESWSDERGETRIPVDHASHLEVEQHDYDAVEVVLAPDQRSVTVRLRPNVVRGTVIDRVDERPLAGVVVKAVQMGRVVTETRTGPLGQYTLRGVPEGATLLFEHDDYEEMEVTLEQRTEVSVTLRRDVLTGRIEDTRGMPVVGATIAIGDVRATSDADGAFRLSGVPEQGEVVVKAPGYRAIAVQLPPSSRLNVQLEPIEVRAIYISAAVAAKPAALAERLALVERSELNAVVIDLKDSTGRVFYASQVPLAREIGAVYPIFDPEALVGELHRRNIYAIARIVVFEDPVLAEARPAWAIKDASTGGIWRTWKGIAWVNAYRSEVWDYNIALALEAASFGFDEIQFDYVRFPSDGPLVHAEYGVEHNRTSRIAAIGEFLARAHRALAPTRAYLAADIFGLQLWELGDSGIGQNLEVIAERVDYICPMVYPSHFYPGSMGFEIPNDHPYEVILWSLQNGLERIPEHARKLRPWLQDFSYGRGIEYGPNEVRAQIRAVADAGLNSWMLWNADSVYHEEALTPS